MIDNMLLIDKNRIFLASGKQEDHNKLQRNIRHHTLIVIDVFDPNMLNMKQGVMCCKKIRLHVQTIYLMNSCKFSVI